jgi:twitching motility protein PilT
MTASTGRRIDRFLKLMQDRAASDLHLSVGRPPMMRISGDLDTVGYRVLDNRDFVDLMKPIMEPHQWRSFKDRGDLDLAYSVPGVARFRVNLFMQERGYGAVFRIIPSRLMTFDQLGLPPAVEKLCWLERGLVLITGPTGSGKSTTLSAIINRMNEERALHIITIEDPIEFVHPNKKSIVSQREIGPHAVSFADAVMSAVREDPDVILVGEMRDLETIRTAIGAAEAGFFVFGTLHTNNAAKAIDRILNVFPEAEQEGVRGALAESLQGVLAQQLLKRIDGGRTAAIEILFGSQALSSQIREGKTAQITSSIQMGKRQGMIAMDDALFALFQKKICTAEAVYEKCVDKSAMKQRLESADRSIALEPDT